MTGMTFSRMCAVMAAGTLLSACGVDPEQVAAPSTVTATSTTATTSPNTAPASTQPAMSDSTDLRTLFQTLHLEMADPTNGAVTPYSPDDPLNEARQEHVVQKRLEQNREYQTSPPAHITSPELPTEPEVIDVTQLPDHSIEVTIHHVRQFEDGAELTSEIACLGSPRNTEATAYAVLALNSMKGMFP